MNRIFFLAGFITLSFLHSCNSTLKPTESSKIVNKQPNVIIVMTDDQGYGDVGALGNTIVKTPAIDNFYNESVHLTDFHVAPTCAPTRAGLMTGCYANRVGVWHTVGGFSILKKNQKTMAQAFNDNGYATAMFGKWHLGDAYPARPQDKGFDYTIIHGGGGVTQTPDYWNNDYFDDTYLKNDTPQKFTGYCTDVWFNEAIKYIEEKKEEPFFCYIATNAPHGPFNVPLEYYNEYKDLPIPEIQKRFYGMISNVDDNFEKLENKLKELNLFDNTILIFMTDNGTSVGYRGFDGIKYGFNAGMRGTKNSEYEGGHRVPFFISYPKGNIKGGRDVSTLTANVDVLPTLAGLCNLEISDYSIDGMDVSSIILNKKTTLDRDYIVTDSQRKQAPIKWRKSAVMSDKLRLVNGVELYNLEEDPNQQNDLSLQYPSKVKTMRSYYNEWWASVSSDFNIDPIIIVGSDYQNPVTITSHDIHLHESKISYDQNLIREASKNSYGGSFAIEFDKSGLYEVELSRWPFESGLKFNDAPKGIPETLTTHAISDGKKVDFKSATLKFNAWKETKNVDQNAISVKFKSFFTKGKSDLEAWFTNASGENWGAYYIRIKKI
jgi:arylsulfatase A-like enzyme